MLLWISFVLFSCVKLVVALVPTPNCTQLQKYDSVQGKCVCKNNLEGDKCDGNITMTTTEPLTRKPVPILTGGLIALIVAASIIVIILVVGVILTKIRRRGYMEQRSVSLNELTEEFDDFDSE